MTEKGVHFSIGRLWTLLRKLDLRFKKSLHASERDTEASQKQRAEFLATIRAISPERLIYLDESGVTTSRTQFYGRSSGG